MSHFGPIIEAEKDETLSQYLLNVINRHQSSLLDLRHPYFSKNHEFRVTLLNIDQKIIFHPPLWVKTLIFFYVFDWILMNFERFCERNSIPKKFIFCNQIALFGRTLHWSVWLLHMLHIKKCTFKYLKKS